VLEEALLVFDPELPVPPDVLGVAHFLGWLLRSGVYVFIDEFQRLANISGMMEALQDQFDFKSHTHAGTLLVLGSHVTEMDRILVNQQSPLFGRGFNRIRIDPLPVDVSLKFLMDSFKISASRNLTLYT